MNWLRWLECWWHGRHVFTLYQGGDGVTRRRCVRCGIERAFGSSSKTFRDES